MKKLIVSVCILFFSVAIVSADFIRAPYPCPGNLKTGEKGLSIASWYASAGLFFGVNAKPGNSWAATVILSNNWGLGFSVKNAEYTAKNLPPAYSGGLQIFGDNTPHDYLEVNSLLLVRQFKMRNPRMRFAVEAGPAWVRSITKDFMPISRPGAWFDIGPNYETSNTYKENIGLSFRAKMEVPLARILSAELALFGNINNIKPIAGAEICLNFGKIRNKKI